jgi:hypothetical protein
MHINFLTTHSFTNHEMPQLTTRNDVLSSTSGPSLSEEEAAHLSTLDEESKEDKLLRLPLQLALALSPLYLLFPKKLCRKEKYGRQTIINVSPWITCPATAADEKIRPSSTWVTKSHRFWWKWRKRFGECSSESQMGVWLQPTP